MNDEHIKTNIYGGESRFKRIIIKNVMVLKVVIIFENQGRF